MSILYLYSSNARDNTYYLNEAIKGKYKLLSFCFTNNIFNVNDTNNKIPFNENGVDLVATLTNGYNDINDLKDNISSALNNVASGTLSVAVDTKTNKFTIANGLAFYFTFGTNTSNSSRILLGFNESDGSNSIGQTSDNPSDLNTYKNVFIDIADNNKKEVFGVNYFNSSLIVNGLGGFGEIFRYVDSDNFNQIIDFKNTKSFEIKFHDDSNNTIDLNSEYCIILKKV